jgi:predicted CXXCH cytochrome family protein
LRCHISTSAPGHAFANGHPVGVLYPMADANFAPDAVVLGAGLVLPGGRLECVTCHDVHDAVTPGRIRIENTGSRLCLTCHRK